MDLAARLTTGSSALVPNLVRTMAFSLFKRSIALSISSEARSLSTMPALSRNPSYRSYTPELTTSLKNYTTCSPYFKAFPLASTALVPRNPITSPIKSSFTLREFSNKASIVNTSEKDTRNPTITISIKDGRISVQEHDSVEYGKATESDSSKCNPEQNDAIQEGQLEEEHRSQSDGSVDFWFLASLAIAPLLVGCAMFAYSVYDGLIVQPRKYAHEIEQQQLSHVHVMEKSKLERDRDIEKKAIQRMHDIEKMNLAKQLGHNCTVWTSH